MLPADNRSIDQPGTLEDFHVFADGRLADLEWGGKLTDCGAALRESRQDATAGAVGKREENPIELLAGLLHGKYS